MSEECRGDEKVWSLAEMVQWYRDNTDFTEYECQVMAERDYEKQ